MYYINKIHQVAVGKNLANENSLDVETTTLVNEYSIPDFTDNVKGRTKSEGEIQSPAKNKNLADR